MAQTILVSILISIMILILVACGQEDFQAGFKFALCETSEYVALSSKIKD